jgi:hypothetical protein
MIRKIKRKTVYENTIQLNGSERLELGGFLKRADTAGRSDGNVSVGYSKDTRIAIRSELMKCINGLLQKAYNMGVEDRKENVA